MVVKSLISLLRNANEKMQSLHGMTVRAHTHIAFLHLKLIFHIFVLLLIYSTYLQRILINYLLGNVMVTRGNIKKYKPSR